MRTYGSVRGAGTIAGLTKQNKRPVLLDQRTRRKPKNKKLKQRLLFSLLNFDSENEIDLITENIIERPLKCKSV